MEQKNNYLTTILLVIAIIIIAIMGYFLYKNHTEKMASDNSNTLNNQTTEVQNSIQINTIENNTNSEISTEQEISSSEKENSNIENSNYNKNYSTTVFKNLDETSNIVIPIWAYSGYSNITINNKNEAYWNNQGNDTFPETSNTKVADNVINAWYCPLGQDIESNACILFLKDDGSVTYIRFYIAESPDGSSYVNCSKEKKLNDLSGISNVLVVENGFYGAMFIKEDGTAIKMPLTKLDDLTAQN